MAIVVSGTTGSGIYIDVNGTMYTVGSERSYTTGGEYVVAGWSTGVVAAGIVASTPLVTMRFSTGSARKAYITRARFSVTVATVGASAGVGGVLSWQRFNTATPTGGNARTADKKNAAHPSASDMADIRDSNAALTVTSVVFGNISAASVMPTYPQTTSGLANGGFEWIFEPDDEPLVLAAGDGISMRTQLAMPATTTWTYAYTVHWYEK